MTTQAASSPIVRRATSADLESLGRLGALLVQAHHAFDERRFLAAGTRTPGDYAAFLGVQLQNPDVVIFVAEQMEVIGYAFASVGCY
jgi:hypothetical protein